MDLERAEGGEKRQGVEDVGLAPIVDLFAEMTDERVLLYCDKLTLSAAQEMSTSNLHPMIAQDQLKAKCTDFVVTVRFAFTEGRAKTPFVPDLSWTFDSLMNKTVAYIFSASCTCGRFKDGTWCAHIACVVLHCRENPKKLISYEEVKKDVERLTKAQLRSIVLHQLLSAQTRAALIALIDTTKNSTSANSNALASSSAGITAGSADEPSGGFRPPGDPHQRMPHPTVDVESEKAPVVSAFKQYAEGKRQQRHRSRLRHGHHCFFGVCSCDESEDEVDYYGTVESAITATIARCKAMWEDGNHSNAVHTLWALTECVVNQMAPLDSAGNDQTTTTATRATTTTTTATTTTATTAGYNPYRRQFASSSSDEDEDDEDPLNPLSSDAAASLLAQMNALWVSFMVHFPYCDEDRMAWVDRLTSIEGAEEWFARAIYAGTEGWNTITQILEEEKQRIAAEEANRTSDDDGNEEGEEKEEEEEEEEIDEGEKNKNNARQRKHRKRATTSSLKGKEKMDADDSDADDEEKIAKGEVDDDMDEEDDEEDDDDDEEEEEEGNGPYEARSRARARYPWTCQQCTYRNPEGRFACEMCGMLARKSRRSERSKLLESMDPAARRERYERYIMSVRMEYLHRHSYYREALLLLDRFGISKGKELLLVHLGRTEDAVAFCLSKVPDVDRLYQVAVLLMDREPYAAFEICWKAIAKCVQRLSPAAAAANNNNNNGTANGNGTGASDNSAYGYRRLPSAAHYARDVKLPRKLMKLIDMLFLVSQPERGVDESLDLTKVSSLTHKCAIAIAQQFSAEEKKWGKYSLRLAKQRRALFAHMPLHALRPILLELAASHVVQVFSLDGPRLHLREVMPSVQKNLDNLLHTDLHAAEVLVEGLRTQCATRNGINFLFQLATDTYKENDKARNIALKAAMACLRGYSAMNSAKSPTLGYASYYSRPFAAAEIVLWVYSHYLLPRRPVAKQQQPSSSTTADDQSSSTSNRSALQKSSSSSKLIELRGSSGGVLATANNSSSENGADAECEPNSTVLADISSSTYNLDDFLLLCADDEEEDQDEEGKNKRRRKRDDDDDDEEEEESEDPLLMLNYFSGEEGEGEDDEGLGPSRYRAEMLRMFSGLASPSLSIMRAMVNERRKRSSSSSSVTDAAKADRRARRAAIEQLEFDDIKYRLFRELLAIVPDYSDAVMPLVRFYFIYLSGKLIGQPADPPIAIEHQSKSEDDGFTGITIKGECDDDSPPISRKRKRSSGSTIQRLYEDQDSYDYIDYDSEFEVDGEEEENDDDDDDDGSDRDEKYHTSIVGVAVRDGKIALIRRKRLKTDDEASSRDKATTTTTTVATRSKGKEKASADGGDRDAMDVHVAEEDAPRDRDTELRRMCIARMLKLDRVAYVELLKISKRCGQMGDHIQALKLLLHGYYSDYLYNGAAQLLAETKGGSGIDGISLGGGGGSSSVSGRSPYRSYQQQQQEAIAQKNSRAELLVSHIFDTMEDIDDDALSALAHECASAQVIQDSQVGLCFAKALLKRQRKPKKPVGRRQDKSAAGRTRRNRRRTSAADEEREEEHAASPMKEEALDVASRAFFISKDTEAMCDIAEWMLETIPQLKSSEDKRQRVAVLVARIQTSPAKKRWHRLVSLSKKVFEAGYPEQALDLIDKMIDKTAANYKQLLERRDEDLLFQRELQSRRMGYGPSFLQRHYARMRMNASGRPCSVEDFVTLAQWVIQLSSHLNTIAARDRVKKWSMMLLEVDPNVDNYNRVRKLYKQSKSKKSKAASAASAAEWKEAKSRVMDVLLKGNGPPQGRLELLLHMRMFDPAFRLLLELNETDIKTAHLRVVICAYLAEESKSQQLPNLMRALEKFVYSSLWKRNTNIDQAERDEFQELCDQLPRIPGVTEKFIAQLSKAFAGVVEVLSIATNMPAKPACYNRLVKALAALAPAFVEADQKESFNQLVVHLEMKNSNRSKLLGMLRPLHLQTKSSSSVAASPAASAPTELAKAKKEFP